MSAVTLREQNSCRASNSGPEGPLSPALQTIAFGCLIGTSGLIRPLLSPDNSFKPKPKACLLQSSPSQKMSMPVCSCSGRNSLLVRVIPWLPFLARPTSPPVGQSFASDFTINPGRRPWPHLHRIAAGPAAPVPGLLLQRSSWTSLSASGAPDAGQGA